MPLTAPGAGSATSWASTGNWLEKVGSDDCHGRALWVLGACVGRSQAARPPVLGLAALRPGAADDHRDDLAAGLGVRLDRRLPVSPAIQRRPAGQPGARHLDRAADRVLRQDRDRRLALVRGGLELRQRQAASRPDRQRALRRRQPGLGHWACKRCGGWSSSKNRRPGTSARSAPTAFTTAIASGPSSTSSRSRPTPPSPPASRPTMPPTTRSGSRRPGWRSSGSWAATTWGSISTTPRPAAAATVFRKTASTSTRGPSRPWRSCWPWAK